MNQRYVLVANSLNVVLAKAVLQHRRAFKSFNSDNFCSVVIFETVASTNRACRAGGRSECSQAQLAANTFVYKFKNT